MSFQSHSFKFRLRMEVLIKDDLSKTYYINLQQLQAQGTIRNLVPKENSFNYK